MIGWRPSSNRCLWLGDEKKYCQWRSIRDSAREDFSEQETDEWSKKLTEARPQLGWDFILGYAMARIDPKETGIELLSHNLAGVRYGAWMSLGSVGTLELLKMLHHKRQKSEEPLFRYAAYRAMDEILVYLEVNGDPDELAALQAFSGQVKNTEGLSDRVG